MPDWLIGMDTRPITGYYTAMIVFVWQSDAIHFVCPAPRSRLGVGCDEEVKLGLINTPPYPMSDELANHMYNKSYKLLSQFLCPRSIHV